MHFLVLTLDPILLPYLIFILLSGSSIPTEFEVALAVFRGTPEPRIGYGSRPLS